MFGGPLKILVCQCTGQCENDFASSITFGDLGSLQHNGDEQVAGDTLENPDESMEKTPLPLMISLAISWHSPQMMMS
jgi:hypothetical protein